MATREIAPDQWSEVLDAFSLRHEGWIVLLGVVGPRIGDQEPASRLPLVHIVVDRKDAERRIAIVLGGRPDAHVTHIVDRPERVWLKEREQAADEAVEIECSDGSKTIVAFRYVPPAQPERLLPGQG